MDTIIIGTPDIDCQFDSDKDREMVAEAGREVIDILMAQGEAVVDSWGDDGGSYEYPHEKKLPKGFSHARALLRAYKLLKTMRVMGKMMDDESTKTFLVSSILTQRELTKEIDATGE